MLWMQTIEEYAGLLDDLSASAKRWQEWVEIERPEEDPLPGGLMLHSILLCTCAVLCIFKLENLSHLNQDSGFVCDR